MLRIVAALAAGVTAAILMWPRDCMRTLVGGVGAGDEANPERCTAFLGLPTNRVVAVLVGIAIAALVLKALSRTRTT